MLPCLGAVAMARHCHVRGAPFAARVPTGRRPMRVYPAASAAFLRLGVNPRAGPFLSDRFLLLYLLHVRRGGVSCRVAACLPGGDVVSRGS